MTMDTPTPNIIRINSGSQTTSILTLPELNQPTKYSAALPALQTSLKNPDESAA